MTCEHCERLVATEKERIQWSKELSSTNISLLKKINEQEELLRILKSRLLFKQSNFMTESAQSFMEHINNLAENKTLHNDLARYLQEKLTEITELARLFNSEREEFQREIEENEKYLSEKITYLHGQLDYFRDSFFQELEKSNKLKQYYTKKLQEITSISHQVVLDTLKEKEVILNNELKLRYQKTIQKSKEEIERQSQLVSKLRKHNKQLYLQIHKTKIGNEEKLADLHKSLQDQKLLVRQLQQKNENLRKQIKLEVEGCQNDISDTRKRLRQLIKA